MKLKRIFSKDKAGNPTTVSHIKVLEEPRNGTWNVSPRLMNGGLAEGWLSVGGGVITLKTAEREPDVQYKITREPGHYCVYCGERLGNSKEGAVHVLKHKDEKLATLTEAGKLPENCTPQMIDQINNPAGWGKFNHFVCERVN